jgi:hypothetical protein
MIFYLLLAVSTIITVFLTFLLWRRTRNFAFVFGSFALYFWSLYGAWPIVYNKLTNSHIFHYQYLETRLFPINLDYDYFVALLIYSIFIWTVLGVLALLVKRQRPVEGQGLLKISHAKLIAISIIAGALSLLIIYQDFFKAVEMGESVYAYTRFTSNIFFTWHQILNRVALLPLAFGLAVFFSGKNPKFVIGERNKIYFFAYAIVLAAMSLFCLYLGNKNELFFAFIAGFLFYLANVRKIPVVLLAIAAVVGISFLGLVDKVRGLPPQQIAASLTVKNSMEAFVSIAASNEAFGPHFSLYGILHNNIPMNFGISIGSLIIAIIPRFFWPSRPGGSYEVYAAGVDATPGQGYGIHHAASWYINFGVLGVVIGAVLLASIWAFLFNGFYKANKYKSLLARIFFLIVPWTFIAYIPIIVRSGAEVYKGVIIEAVILPVIIFYFTVVKNTARIEQNQTEIEQSRNPC